MKKIKLCGISLCTLLAATGANAAGYTCEELIEYTSCMSGYYLNTPTPTCPAGYSYVRGVCDSWDEGVETGYTAEECMDYWCEGMCEDPSDYADKWMGDGCYMGDWDEEGENWVDDFIPKSSTAECLECPAGSYCAGGTADKKLCAAGTYQPDTKQESCKTTPKNNYSYAGAKNYTACPATGLTDKDGNTVTAETASTGSTSASACFIGNNWYFQDTKGVYHFKSNCNAFDMSVATQEEKQARCESFGGTYGRHYNMNEMGYIWYCVLDDLEYNFTDNNITTEEACDQLDSCSWGPFGGDDCECECDDGKWTVSLVTGVRSCTQGI